MAVPRSTCSPSRRALVAAIPSQGVRPQRLGFPPVWTCTIQQSAVAVLAFAKLGILSSVYVQIAVLTCANPSLGTLQACNSTHVFAKFVYQLQQTRNESLPANSCS